MVWLSEAIPHDRFEDLPEPRSASGGVRKVGVEIEFTGMTEHEAAEVVARALGGTVVVEAPYEIAVEDTEIGRVRCFLDTAFRKGSQNAVARLGLELGREVIPVELVTAPLAPALLPRLEALRETLRQGGAVGSREGFLLSFGVHLNVEVASEDVASWRPVLTAFALIEDWLRFSDPIDGSRRLLPFVDPYPAAFVRGLIDLDPQAGAAEVIGLYLEETPTRNRALDMLPLFAWIAPERLAAEPDLGKVNARPTYHYRLPDSRIDEPAWHLAYEWNRWALVERVAADADLLAVLARDWRKARWRLRQDWCQEVEGLLVDAGMLDAAA